MSERSEMSEWRGGDVGAERRRRRRWVRGVPLHHPPLEGASPRSADLQQVALSVGLVAGRGRKGMDRKDRVEMHCGVAGLRRWKCLTRSRQRRL